jgi:CDP-paratose synthetase
MNILLTGASGFLGRHLIKRLLIAGHSIVAVYRDSTQLNQLDGLINQVQWFPAKKGFKACFTQHPQLDVVIHTAACYGRNGESLDLLLNTNTLWPLSCLQAAMEHGVHCFINTDSSLPRATNAYALSKSQFLDWGRWLGEIKKINFINIRMEHMFGPGDDPSKFPTHVIKACSSNVPELFLTEGLQRRDFIYIDDVIQAYYVLLNHTPKLGLGFHEYELGSGSAGTIREFVELVHRLTGSQTRLQFGAVPYRATEPKLSVADTSRLNALGWRCVNTLEMGIQKTLDGMKQ